MKKAILFIIYFTSIFQLISAQKIEAIKLEKFWKEGNAEKMSKYLKSFNSKIIETELDKANYYYYLGFVHFYNGDFDSAYANFLIARPLLKKVQLVDQYQMTNLVLFESINNLNNKTINGLEYLKEFLNYAILTKNSDKLSLAYFELGYYYIKSDNKKGLLNLNKAIVENLKTKNDKLNAKIHHNMAQIYSDDSIKKFELAQQHYDLAIPVYQKYHLIDYIANIYESKAIIYAKQKNYKAAFDYFKKSDSVPIKLNYYRKKALLYQSIADMFEMQKDFENAVSYAKKSKEFEMKFNESEQNKNLIDSNAKYQVKQKDQQLSFLKSKFTQNKILYLSLIFGVFLLALYSFIRWKKEDKMRKNALLEAHYIKTEYHEAVEELKKIKQLVIQDHIILKNKAKVNLDDLFYIKADDHYLQLVTNKKNEFVREKLTEILNQLPPNFIKCHRSFIVNKNHIKRVEKLFVIMNDNTEIPISRGFKITL